MPRKKVDLVTVVAPGHCVFCGSAEDNEEKFGKLIHKFAISVHYFCMLFSSALVQRGKDSQGIMGFMLSDIKDEVSRGRRLRCSFCKHPGATVGCVVTSCRRAFHFGCGVENGGLNQYYGSFNSFCFEHRPRQSHPSGSDRLAFHGTAKSTCSICMCAVEARASDSTLRAPCCKNGWFHRSCVQKHATCAGIHFFKCPLCNNTDVFQQEMLKYGIYLPDQDAAWEKDPNAYHELLERHSRCDMPKCICSKGRGFHQDKGKWFILLCRWCGSVGCHVACSGHKSMKVHWVCSECLESAGNLKTNQPPKQKSPKFSLPAAVVRQSPQVPSKKKKVPTATLR